jgi:hypothetical protein
MDLAISLFPSLLQLSPATGSTMELVLVGLIAALLLTLIITTLAMRQSVEALTRVVRRTPGDITEAITDARQVTDELRSLTSRSRPDDDAPPRAARRSRPERERPERDRPERERPARAERQETSETAAPSEGDRERKRRRKRRGSRDGRDRARAESTGDNGATDQGAASPASPPESSPPND